MEQMCRRSEARFTLRRAILDPVPEYPAQRLCYERIVPRPSWNHVCSWKIVPGTRFREVLDVFSPVVGVAGAHPGGPGRARRGDLGRPISMRTAGGGRPVSTLSEPSPNSSYRR